MGSRKEEERNEKIIRGLMKLPPNRRCINCNSLGPQYVCTNFWTFICTTCSGIHREFTHRVKSVSMSKFTSQEVEALQSGGNQRAREIYLKDWDLQRQRLPDSSKVEKVRDFIKFVYVDRRYSGGKASDKPPRDLQSHKSLEDETRRASSYHSYSQSPPYDDQYEDRRYGKHTAVLTRKPGSDRGLYEGKISNFVYSPGRLSEQTFEDRFANEGSSSRVSDYSMSSGGDFRSGVESPNFQKDIGFSSPPIQPSRVRSFEDVHRQTVNKWSEVNAKKEADGIPHPQRTTSLGSFGSFDSNSMSLKSCNSGTLTDVVPEPEQSVGTYEDLSTFPQPSVQVGSGNLDLFKVPALLEPVNSAASSIDLFQLPATSSAPPLDLFQPSLDFFAFQQQPATNLDKKIPELSVPKNDGWATFDTQPTAAIPLTENRNPATIPSSDGGSLGNFDPFSAMDTNMQWPPFQNFSGHGPSSTASNSWHEGLHNVQVPAIGTSTQAWNAFEDSTGPMPFEEIKQISGPQVAAHKPPSTCDQYLGLRASKDSNRVGNQRAAYHDGPLAPVVPPHVTGQSYTPSMLPLMGETRPHATDRKSTNPFDLPCDSDLEQNHVFLEMSSLQAALPDAQLQSTFLGGTQPWFPQNPVAPYIPAAPQGGLAYMAGQSSSPQIPLFNVCDQQPDYGTWCTMSWHKDAQQSYFP